MIEGWLALERALATGQTMRSVLVADTRLERLADDVLADGPSPATDELTTFVAPAAVIAEIVGFDLHRGVVAVAERRRADRPGGALAPRSRRMLIVEAVNDAENLGVLFRNAAALGADGVLMDPTSPDPLARRTVRVSTGHVLTRAVGAAAVAPRPRGHHRARHDDRGAHARRRDRPAGRRDRAGPAGRGDGRRRRAGLVGCRRSTRPRSAPGCRWRGRRLDQRRLSGRHRHVGIFSA